MKEIEVQGTFDTKRFYDVLGKILSQKYGVQIIARPVTEQKQEMASRQEGGDNDASKKTAEIPDLERHLCSGRGNCRTGDGRIR